MTDQPKKSVARIPTLPELIVDPSNIEKPDQRAVACVNLRMAGAPFHEIAKELGYASPQAAKDAYVAALAGMHPAEDWETQREVEAMRALTLFRQALAMAQADYLVDANDPTVRIPNTEKRAWNETAQKALALHAMITGAKAPSRMEVSASTQELNSMVQVILSAQGKETEIEADVWDVDEIPSPEADPMGMD